MKAPEVNHSDGEDHSQQDPLDGWILLCSKCNKSISASRPPVHIAENCSCAELSAVTEGLAQASIEDKPNYSGDTFQHGSADTPKYQRPPTYASSYNSVEGPEGPEKTDPNIAISRPSPNNWIALGPERGLNENQHRRTSSFNEEMPETLQRFLLHKEDYHFFFDKVPGNQDHTFLRQETFVRSSYSMKAKKGTKASEQSSMTPSGTGSGSFVSWGVDPVAGAGEWADDDHDYPLWMSESSFEDF